MFSLICGFLWGCFYTLLLIDLFTALINIVWWIYLILFFVLLINSIVLRVYLYVSDYKGLAMDGISVGSKIVRYIINKRKNNKQIKD